MLYTLYEFIDDGPEDDDPSDPPFIGPIPTIDITKIDADYIPRRERLLDLMEDHDRTDAFVIWASETLGIYDTARRYTDNFDIDLDSLESARGRVVQIQTEQASAGRRFCDTQPELRLALAPLVAQGMCMRTIANYLDMPLAEVVKVQIGPRAGRRAEKIADLEEAVMDGALERESQRDLLGRLGLADSWALLRHVCEIHDVSPKEAAKARAAA